MIALVIAGLAVGLLFLLRLLWKQNRALRQLRDAAKRQQPFLHEEPLASFLPNWSGLVETVNQLVTENSTLQQQRTGQLTQLEATLGNLREAVLIVDEENYIHLANRALREIFPSSRDLVNLRLELIIRSVPFIEYVRATRAGQPLPRQEFEIIDGAQTLWIEASGAPIASPDGKSQWALFVIHNLTNERKLERVRRDFVANASHELKSPLTAVRAAVETLQGFPRGNADETRFIDLIARNTERIDALIGDLLEIARLESGELDLRPEVLPAAPCLERAVSRHAARAQMKSIDLQCSAEPNLSVRADPRALEHVLDNLIDNALKYCPQNTRVRVSAEAEHTQVRVRVTDTGPGIAAEHLPRLFERFYRVDAGRSRELGGTGLGLSIVKHLVEAMGGSVAVDSSPGAGSTFSFALPAS